MLQRLVLVLVLLSLSIFFLAHALGGYVPLDDFNRANVGPPPSASWSTGILAGQPAGHRVQGNLLVVNAVNASSWWNVRTFGPDASAAVVLVNATTTSITHVRLYLRITQPAVAAQVDGYVCQAECAPTASQGTMVLRRVDNSTLTGILAQNTAVTWGTGDGVGCEMRGTQLCGYRRAAGATTWTQLICFTDATYTTAGFVGLGMNGTEITVDDFWAGTLRRKGRVLAMD